MSLRAWSGLALVAGVAIACAALPARAKESKAPPDLSGEWRIDPSKSDEPRAPEAARAGRRPGMRPDGGGWGGGMGGRGGGGGMPPGGMPGGGMRGGGRRGGGAGEGFPGREAPNDSARAAGPGLVRLPDALFIEQAGDVVIFGDSTGAVVQEVGVNGIPADTSSRARGARLALGEWKGDRLVVERSGAWGSKITETYELKQDGRRLLVRTKIESDGPMGSIEFKREYERAGTGGDAADLAAPREGQ